MNKLMKIIAEYNENKLQAIIAKTGNNDERKVIAYANRSTYVNPRVLLRG